MRINPTSRCAGFSLVEVMVATLVLGIAVAGLTQGITTALGSSKDAELQARASLAAAGQIELLRADGFIVEGVTTGTCGPGLSKYQWTQRISKASLDGLYEVEVLIEHSETGMVAYQLRTQLFDPPATSLTGEDSKRPKNPRDRRRGKGRP